MPENKKPSEAVDWNLATWDGARREALRRWAQLPLECVIAALEEMQELSDLLAKTTADADSASRPIEASAVQERPENDQAKIASHGSRQADNNGSSEE